MEHVTIGKNYNKGKVALVECIKNDTFENIDIKNKCFLLIILSKGKLEFEINGQKITATAPAFLCFDETENPCFNINRKAKYTCVYFNPIFLNVNMTFEMLRSNNYSDIATTTICLC